MLLVLALALATGLAVTVYALWPRTRTFTYAIANDESAVSSFYKRTAHGWFEKWNQRWEYTGGTAPSPRLVGGVMLTVPAVIASVTGLLTGNLVIAVLLEAGLVAGPWLLLGTQVRKREQVITSQLVDFLEAVGANLDTNTPELAIRRAAAATHAPLSHELAQFTADLDARVNLSVALQNLANRNASRSMAFACATLDMAKQTGSAEITTNLSELAKLIRANERTAADIKNKTLILRVAAKLFLLMPAAAMLVSIPSFGIEPWFTPAGYGAIAFMVVTTVGSYFGFRKLQQWQVGV